ncbi:MAG: dUTP diphosphatase [Desulfovibrio sp.]|nr:dUTP diphosphatase [Desulfovibrio sp.]
MPTPSLSDLTLRYTKLTPEARTPERSTEGAAGFDLVAVTKKEDPERGCTIYGTGIAVEIPKGFMGLLFPRSSVYKKGLQLANSVGIIDSDYRGEVKAIFRNVGAERYEVGERICQLVIIPVPAWTLEEVEQLSGTARGSGGFGSTGA